MHEQRTGYGYCECGCGERTSVAKLTNTKRGHAKGRHVRFVAGHYRRMLGKQIRASLPTSDTGTCWEFPGPRNPQGYGRIGSLPAHRVAYEQAHGPIPDGLYVLHRCDNPPCCNPAHLVLGTHADNMADMAAKERARATKLTRADVTAIRSRYADGELQDALAAEYGVTQGAISLITLGRNWRTASRA